MRCEFHCHSKYSPDSIVELEEIVAICEKNNINSIFLTDHNEILGAIKLKKIAPNWLTVIIGEEIKTNEGEIIGIFLKKKIFPGMSLKETVREIRKQGGISVLPHPFDRLRTEKLQRKTIEKNVDLFDVVEISNNRTFFRNDNQKALEFSEKHNLPCIAGSDAHLIDEYGKTILEGIDVDSPEIFLKSLKQMSFIENKIPFYYHLIGKYNKWRKKITK